MLEEDETKAKLLAIVTEVNKMPAQQQQMGKMMRLLPAVQEASGPIMAEYGFQASHAMMFMMQMQARFSSFSAIFNRKMQRLPLFSCIVY